MTTITSQHFPGSYKQLRHSSGLDIILYPMNDFNSAYALFSTKFGSVDNAFKTTEDKDFITIPDGLAHFLEHKMFEKEDGDAFSRYAKTGASGNAYTSFDKTGYLFSTTSNFDESLEILLDLVTTPYYTPETVEKEQGIIGQEIKMYQDDADWRVFFGLLGGMYHNNPVRIDIAGTVESIAKIDDQLLYRCHNTFYNLNNMVLILSGNFNVDSALKVVDRMLDTPAKQINIQRSIPAEPYEVKESLVEISLPIAQPMFELGFKGTPKGDKEDMIDSLRGDVLFSMLTGTTSKFYKKLYDEGLINSTFGGSVNSGRGFCYCSFSGESRDPKRVKDAIIEELKSAQKNGLDEEAFLNCKKAIWGRRMAVYSSVEGVASFALSAYYCQLNAYSFLDIISDMQLDDVESFLHNNLDVDRYTLSIVNPK